MSKPKNKPRNPFHNHPLMFKGGVHEKSDKAKRRTEKQKLKKQWCSLITLNQCYLTTSLFSAGSLMIKHLTVDQVDEGLSPFQCANINRYAKWTKQLALQVS